MQSVTRAGAQRGPGRFAVPSHRHCARPVWEPLDGPAPPPPPPPTPRETGSRAGGGGGVEQRPGRRRRNTTCTVSTIQPPLSPPHPPTSAGCMSAPPVLSTSLTLLLPHKPPVSPPRRVRCCTGDPPLPPPFPCRPPTEVPPAVPYPTPHRAFQAPEVPQRGCGGGRRPAAPSHGPHGTVAGMTSGDGGHCPRRGRPRTPSSVMRQGAEARAEKSAVCRADVVVHAPYLIRLWPRRCRCLVAASPQARHRTRARSGGAMGLHGPCAGAATRPRHMCRVHCPARHPRVHCPAQRHKSRAHGPTWTPRRRTRRPVSQNAPGAKAGRARARASRGRGRTRRLRLHSAGRELPARGVLRVAPRDADRAVVPPST